MDSRRELILQNVVTRLEAIKTDAGYNFVHKLKSVQRYVHQWEDEGHIVNLYKDSPTIIVRVVDESSSANGVNIPQGLWENTLVLDLWWVETGDSWNCEDASAALADMKRALFFGQDIGFGVGASNPSLQNQMMDLQRGAALDGLHLTLTLTYLDQIGNPELGL